MKKSLAILYGGRSVEHEISIRSAKNVIKAIDTDRFEIILLGISKEGKWFVCQDIDMSIEMGSEISLSLSAIPKIFNFNGTAVGIDIAFPLLHGTDGEDGAVQGFFKMIGIPVVGSDVTGSAIAIDKILSKQLWQQAGIPIAAFASFTTEEIQQQTYEDLASRFGNTFMVKAGNLGSSVGVSKVKDQRSYLAAVNESTKYSSELLVEQFVSGRELECAVLGNGNNIECSNPGEILLNASYDFYNYEAKYENEDAIKIDIPAQLDQQTINSIQKACKQAFQVSRCCDYGRVDLFLTNENKVVINEINTIPGFTDVSMFPMLWKDYGIEYKQLINTIIDLCLARWNESSVLSTDYKTNINN